MSDLDKLHALCLKNYKSQAVWFLNCFWEEFAEKEAEIIWQYVLKNNELDIENHADGSGLDEMKAHVFLEKFDETLTVRDMRDKLRSTGAIGETERPKTVPLIHYLLYKYNANWHTLVDEGRQGDNKEELAKAEKLLAEVQQLFRESEAKASEARKSHNEAQSAEASAKAREAEAVAAENQAKAREADAVAAEEQARQREAEAKQREAEAKQREAEALASEKQAKDREAAAKASAAEAKERDAKAQQDAQAAKAAEAEAQAAQRELEVALAVVHAEEKAYNDKKADLEKKSEEGGVVSR